MIKNTLKVRVTVDGAIIRKDAVVRVKDTGNNFWLVTHTLYCGRWFSTEPMSLFLKREQFEFTPTAATSVVA